MPFVTLPHDPFLNALFAASVQGGVLVLLVLLIQFVAGRRLTAHGRYALWSVVVIRLLLPVVPESPVSLWSLLPSNTPAPTAIIETPAVTPPPAPGVAWSHVPMPPLPDSLKPAAPAPPVTFASPAFTPTTALLTAWLAGFVLVLLRAAIAHHRLVRRRRQLSRGVETAHRCHPFHPVDLSVKG